MKPKPFTFDRLLSIRRLRQRQREQALATAAMQVRRQETLVQAAVDRQVTARDDLRTVLGGKMGQPDSSREQPLDVTEARRFRGYLAFLAREAGQAAAALPALRESETAARKDLAEVRKAAKVLENLRDRRRVALRRWSRKQEQKVLDDLGIRHVPRMDTNARE